ncbi:MAG: nucleoside 2-deoxyribosyltransferase [Methanoregula sp.]|jgi:nucleoside 2-deoxyribosyltransferase/predicted secreted protein|nr:nucleoside 2-deoxyribosyltransferase [Methanoregula sp.]
MYVLFSPCILDPALRIEGITKPSDLVLFERCIERCNKFGIEIVPLPCPETLYLGAKRTPGTFLERLNFPEFINLIDVLAEEIYKIINVRGLPVCIVGVNSSPTCGVTSTYYGRSGNEPPKKAGRGVFLKKFPHIMAMDVGTFSQYYVYLAAPLFSEAERNYNLSIAGLLRKNFFDVFLPQENGDDSETRTKEEQVRIFTDNLKALKNTDILVSIIDGADADSGTSWEMGYASALGKEVIALRTDFRRSSSHEKVNLMLEESATVVISTEQLLEIIKSPLMMKFDS